MIGRWFRMLWKSSRQPSREAEVAHERAEQSLADAQNVRLQSQRLREAAEEAEAAVRRHNASNHYAKWLNDQLRP